MFVIAVSEVQAYQWSSSYICKSERVGYDRIDHCTSYDNPVPDIQYIGYYTEQQIQERNERIEFASNSMMYFGIALMVVFIISIIGLILA
jgi:hypothetical protein